MLYVGVAFFSIRLLYNINKTGVEKCCWCTDDRTEVDVSNGGRFDHEHGQDSFLVKNQNNVFKPLVGFPLVSVKIRRQKDRRTSETWIDRMEVL